ncbi:MAG: bifunctional phosphopantothenoylcysteine decarboxylase/phosphopantothenate--cysteine ligase CoaBC [Deltaproteobacteria bacterium]|nr:bifunctional phosphopantothenoylcysteine decarboxylase/phosphopantothenate--cysteine ligase CoaBC [Deltaproteobacteria bacterium]
MTLHGRQIVLGVGGGIAAYKAAELCRLLVRAGAQVSVAMTAAAQHFVGSATFAALSGQPVATDLFDARQEQEIGHIRLAEHADAFVVAPATANLIARLANGIADDFVTTAALASVCPLLIAPAMNPRMWSHPATQQNIARLQQRGCLVIGPEVGEMACGHHGAGRMTEPEGILSAIGGVLGASGTLRGRTLLVSAGPTREAVDSVRYLTNRSTGKMGHAVAAAAKRAGAQVVLITSAQAVEPPLVDQLVRVDSAAEMAEAVLSRVADVDAMVLAAAVADFRIKAPHIGKLKKASLGETWQLKLERTVDILATVAGRSPRPYLVGFAAEIDQELAQVAERKRQDKGCDMIVANDVSQDDAGFGVDTNRVVICQESGCDALPLMTKERLGEEIVARIAAALERRDERIA